MNLYRWDSEALAQYANGDIIVMAEDVTEARRKAKQVARKQFDYSPGRAKEIEFDLEKEPEIIKSGVLFIGGSA